MEESHLQKVLSKKGEEEMKLRVHKYTKYRPKYCLHPTFESMNYCWGLAVAVDKRALTKFYKSKCRTCDLSKNYKDWRSRNERPKKP